MPQIAVVTDTSSSLTPEAARDLGLHLVPICIQFGSRTYRDGLDMTHDEFYHRLETGEVATTSQPSPGDFLEVYQDLASRFKSIVSIHVTGKASGTVQSANLARQSLPAVDIRVIDSGFTSMALGFMALEAARAAALGARVEEILDLVDSLKPRLDIYAALPTLKYLLKSGRVGKGQGLLAQALSIRPILSMREGLLEAVQRVRSYPRALNRMADLAVAGAEGLPVQVAVLYTRSREGAEDYLASVRDRLDIQGEPQLVEMGPALAAHGGPGMLGLALLKS